MALNLIDLVKDQMTDALVGKVSSLIGENKTSTNSALTSFIPALLGGIVNKGSDMQGASSLLSLINDNNLGGNTLSNLSSLLGGGKQSDGFLEMGGKLIASILGSSQSSVLNNLINLTGLNRNSSSSLMSLLAPIAMGAIGKLVKSDNLDAGGLMRLLMGQKSNVANALPAGMGSVLGFTDNNTPTAQSSSGGGIWKWLIPLLLLLGAVWYFTKDGCSSTPNVATNNKSEIQIDPNAKYVIDEAGNLLDEAGEVVIEAGKYTVDAAGNIVDEAGNILVRAANISKLATMELTEGSVTSNADSEMAVQYTVDADGNLVDANGKIVFKAGEFEVVDGYYVDKDGNRIGKFFKKVGDAIENAAEKTAEAVEGAAGKTADAFKTVFSNLFTKKESTGTVYTLADIEFNKESHRITDFSKAEVEGLAQALQAYPKSKIQVQVYTDDGKNEKENKSLTETRAKVVRDMLVALGVNKNQISVDGKGSEDSAKAANGKVEIVVK